MFQTTHNFVQLDSYKNRTDNPDEFILEYESELAELTFNSKPIINNLTILAEENKHAARDIVAVIEKRILSVLEAKSSTYNIQVETDKKLPSLYLLDSICKNIKGVYVQLFSQNIVAIFSRAYQNFNQQLRTSLLHLFKTWYGLFPADKLQQIESFIQVAPPPPSSSTAAPKAPSILVNPKFVQAAPRIPSSKPPPSKTPIPREFTPQFQEQTKTVAPPVEASPAQPPVAAIQPQPVVLPIVQPSYPPPGMDVITQLQLIVQQRTNQIMNDMKNPSLTQIEQFQIYEQLQKLYSISQILTVQLLQPQNQLTLASVVQSLMSMAVVPSQTMAPDLTSLMMTLQSQASNQSILSSGMANYAFPTSSQPTIPNPFSIQSTLIPSGSSVASKATTTTIPAMASNLSDPWSLDSLKRRDEGVINGLYFAFPLQCKNCGLRFLDRERMDKHLDWHFNQNKREKERVKIAASRSWFLEREEWIADRPYDELDKSNAPSPFAESESKAKSEEIKSVSQVPADENQKNCPICGEMFDQIFDEDQDEWMFKDALISATDNKIYHVHCHYAIAGDKGNTKAADSDSSSEDESSEESEDEQDDKGSQSQPNTTFTRPLDMPPLEDIPSLSAKRVQPEEGTSLGSDTSADQSKRARVVE